MLSDGLCRNNIEDRHNRKSYISLCNQISELELRIALSRHLGIDYTKEQKELNKLYKNLREVKYNGNE